MKFRTRLRFVSLFQKGSGASMYRNGTPNCVYGVSMANIAFRKPIFEQMRYQCSYFHILKANLVYVRMHGLSSCWKSSISILSGLIITA